MIMNSTFEDLILRDVGEFKLLSQYILPKIQKLSSENIGDDCAFIKLKTNQEQLVITTDAGPEPAIGKINYESFFSWGWYLIAVNISDLATTGCLPVTISLSVDAPATMKLSALMDFFDGVVAACSEFGIYISGGNIRESKTFSVHGTAIGILEKEQSRITRSNCRVGDILVSVGSNGLFMSKFLKAYFKGYDSLNKEEKDILEKPMPQAKNMMLLNSKNIFSAASDNSDGVLGSLKNIADGSKCGFLMDLDNISLPEYIEEASNYNNYNKWNIYLSWGDWQIIGTVHKDKWGEFVELTKSQNIQFTKLGVATNFNGRIECMLNGVKKEISLVRNENFTKQSYNKDFTEGLNYFLKTDLFKTIEKNE